MRCNYSTIMLPLAAYMFYVTLFYAVLYRYSVLNAKRCKYLTLLIYAITNVVNGFIRPN